MGNKVWVCDDEPSARFPVFTRGNVGEVFSEVVSPLTWSAYGPHAWDLGWRDALVAMGLFTPDEFKPPGQCEVVGCFGGYVYINMSVTRVLAVRIPGMTVEAIDQSFFGNAPDVPPYRPDPRDHNAARSAEASTWLASLFTRDPKIDTDLDRPQVDAVLTGRPDFASQSDAQLLEYFRSLRSPTRLVFKRHILNTYGSNILTSMMNQISQAAGASDLAAKATSGIGEIDSAGQSLDLWQLSRLVRGSSALTAAFDRGVDGILDRLRSSRDQTVLNFLAQWNGFIERWGFIGPNVWEFRSPSYRSDPRIPLRMLERARCAPDESAPRVRASTLGSEREAAIAAISARLAADHAVQKQFLAAAARVGNYLAARERSKHHCAMVLNEARASMQELGSRLVKRGLLPRWEHVLFVTDGEADAFIASPSDYTGLIQQRPQQFAVLAAKQPPFVFEGSPPPLSKYKDRNSGERQPAMTGTELHGIGVSPGRHTSRARVITSLTQDSQLEAGEVIVAVITDASWGPLFLSAGAVVVETGAIISHAAIVSRELGIPAVVSVPDATRRIRDGTMITVDGNTGTVTVH